RQNFAVVNLHFLLHMLNWFQGPCAPNPVSQIVAAGDCQPPFSFHPGTVSYRHIVILTPIRYMI
ncbi:hypothetical protein K6684_02155, partial [Escherichia coli]|uniref:hypothetical protein n=1 Tax=Escherichia coli TaxID=562 RepID=UPI001C9AE086